MEDAGAALPFTAAAPGLFFAAFLGVTVPPAALLVLLLPLLLQLAVDELRALRNSNCSFFIITACRGLGAFRGWSTAVCFKLSTLETSLPLSPAACQFSTMDRPVSCLRLRVRNWYASFTFLNSSLLPFVMRMPPLPPCIWADISKA